MAQRTPPRTPVRSISAANSGEVHFDGVPGAPRKNESHAEVDRKRTLEERQARVKGVARRLIFGQESEERDDYSHASTSKRAPPKSAPTKQTSECLFLHSPIVLQDKGKARSTTSEPLKRSLSTSTTADDLIDLQAARHIKCNRKMETQAEEARRSLRPSMNLRYKTIMRRANSASSRSERSNIAKVDTRTTLNDLGSSWSRSGSPRNFDILKLQTPSLVDSIIIR